jgi:transketolase
MTLDELAVNTIRFLSADAVQKANSGHPGLPMGMAVPAYTLWTKHLRFDPTDPKWPNRDRFVLSAGHGSMLLYSLLHLAGFDLLMEQIQNFRQWDSITPGHPEYGETPGVETTTGPLGQGFANGVGMALAADHLAAVFNRPGSELIEHYVYAIVSDGDLMEGVASEAASLAGHLQLGRLIYLYDDNRISIDGSTDLSFTEDRAARFAAYGWHLSEAIDGNDMQAVDQAIIAAKSDPRPSLIVCRTHIGYGLPTKQDTADAHGEPPGEEELRAAKQNLGWPDQPNFYVPDEVRSVFAEAAARGAELRKSWLETLERYQVDYPDMAAQWERTISGQLPNELEDAMPVFEPDPKGMASRAASGKTLSAIKPIMPELIGGSADLTGSNKTRADGDLPFSPDDRAARYIHFGVREHAMGSMLSGMALYGGLIPYGGTFLVFSDYMRPAIRLAAMMGLRVIYVFTHDSIGLGEDGPTHQPIEQLAALRAIPNLAVIRPADANETAQAWLAAFRRTTGPSALVLTRQSLPTLDREEYSSAEGLAKGAYVLADLGEAPPELALMASGSEVGLICEAGQLLVDAGVNVRLVSFASWELFSQQSQDYQHQVLPPDLKERLAVEAGSPMGWERWVGDAGKVLALDRFGASAPFEEIYENLGLSVERIVAESQQLVSSVKLQQV